VARLASEEGLSLSWNLERQVVGLRIGPDFARLVWRNASHGNNPVRFRSLIGRAREVSLEMEADFMVNRCLPLGWNLSILPCTTAATFAQPAASVAPLDRTSS